MSAEELDLKAQYDRKPQPVPTVILQLIDEKLVVTTGPRPMPREEYIYDWDTTWNEPGTDPVACDFTIQFQLPASGPPLMVQRVLDLLGDDARLGQWIWDVLHGKDPR